MSQTVIGVLGKELESVLPEHEREVSIGLEYCPQATGVILENLPQMLRDCDSRCRTHNPPITATSSDIENNAS